MRNRILLALFILAAFGVRDAKAQCSTTYVPAMTCAYGDLINSFTLNSITSTGNGSGCASNAYGFYTTPTWLLVPGTTYSWSATVGGGSWSQGFGVWIDFNNNGVFEASEGVVSSGTSTTPSGSITIPANAGGQVRMRTRCSYAYTFSTSDPCTDYHGFGWGETEDYVVTICKAPTIDAQPADTFACDGSGAAFMIAATNAGSYQWQQNAGAGWANVANGTNFSGATTATLTITNAPSTMNLASFRCIAIASCANNVRDTTESAVLTILPNTEIVGQTINDTSCIGLQTKLYVKNDGVIINRRWQIWSDNDNMFVDITGNPFINMGDTLLIDNIPDTLNGAKIRCIVEGVCGWDTTKQIPLVVNAVPEVITSPGDITLDPGDIATFKVIAAGVSVKYQWQAGFNDSFANINDGGIYKGVKTDKLTVTGVSRVQDGFQFRCIVKGSGSCAVEPDTSNFGVLYVNPAVSVEELATGNMVTVFPNPAAGNEIIVRAEHNNQFIAGEYKIIDKLGKVVSTGKLNPTGNTTVNIGNLASDIYTVQVYDENNLKSRSVRFTRL
jgi:hypothetical protein